MGLVRINEVVFIYWFIVTFLFPCLKYVCLLFFVSSLTKSGEERKSGEVERREIAPKSRNPGGVGGFFGWHGMDRPERWKRKNKSPPSFRDIQTQTRRKRFPISLYFWSLQFPPLQ